MSGIPSTMGRYQIQSRIARGGMGTLYSAWDPKLDRQIAIKLLTDDDDSLRERFAREARSVARLHHPNIVTIFDVGDYEGQPFIAMEFVHGETLAALIKNRVPFPIARKLEIIEELGDGLAYAHKIGIVHRDIKPANIMLELDGSVKILDFGIARLGPSTTVTVAGMLLGTLNYMSPEQAKGKVADNRSDLFAVGAVLYELLSYQQAFPGGFQDGVLHRVVSEPPASLDTLCPGLDSEVISVVMRALEKDPKNRYQDLESMVIDVRRIRQRQAADPLSNTAAATVMVPPSGATPDLSRRSADREALARRRAQQIEEHLGNARRLFSTGDFEAAIGECEQILMIDAENAAALELLDRTRAALDERQAEEWLGEAALEIERGALTAAIAKIDRASALVPASARAVDLRKAAEEALAARERERQRAEKLRSLIYRASELFDKGQFTDAIAVADEVLALEGGHQEAQALKTRSLEAARAHEREVLNRRAREAVREARRLFAADDHAGAIELLSRFDSPHDLVAEGLAQLKAESARIAEQRALEAERRAKRERLAAGLAGARAEIGAEDFAAAIAHLHALEQAEGGSPEIAGLMREALAGQQAQELAEKTAKEIAEHVARSAGLLARDNLDGAMERVAAALALDPKHKAALALRSKIADRLRAAAALREAEAARRRQREQQTQASIAKARDATHAVAVSILREALDRDPDHADVKQLLESRRAALAREEAERQRLQEAEAARRAEIARLMTGAREAVRRDDLDAAREGLDRVLSLDPGHGDARSMQEDIELARERRRAEQVAAAGAVTAADEPPPVVSAPVASADATIVERKEPKPRVQTPPPLVRKWTPGSLYLVAGAAAAVVVVGIVVARFASVGPTAPTSTPPTNAETAAVQPSPAGPTAAPSPPVSSPAVPPAAAAPPTPVEPAGSTPSSDAQIDNLRKLARGQLTSGDGLQALATINSGLKVRPGDSELKTLLGATLTDARARLRQAHEAASLAGDDATRSPSYAEALQREPEVARLARAGRTDDAIRSAWAAADLFGRALEDGRRVAANRAASTSSPAGRAAPPVTSPRPPDRLEPAEPPPQTAAAPQLPAPTPAPPPVAAPVPVPPVESAPPRPAPTPPAAPPAPSLASEEQAIRTVLQTYAAAYSGRDAGAVRRVYPTVNEQALRQSFAGLKSLQVQVTDLQISVSGTTATVSCTWTSVGVGQVGGAQRASSKITLRLQKSGETWGIVDRR